MWKILSICQNLDHLFCAHRPSVWADKALLEDVQGPLLQPGSGEECHNNHSKPELLIRQNSLVRYMYVCKTPYEIIILPWETTMCDIPCKTTISYNKITCMWDYHVIVRLPCMRLPYETTIIDFRVRLLYKATMWDYHERLPASGAAHLNAWQS